MGNFWGSAKQTFVIFETKKIFSPLTSSRKNFFSVPTGKLFRGSRGYSFLLPTAQTVFLRRCLRLIFGALSWRGGDGACAESNCGHCFVLAHKKMTARGKILGPLYLFTGVFAFAVMLEDLESDSALNVIDEVRWFYINREAAASSPVRRWLYNVRFRLACARASIRFRFLVQPFLAFL